MALQTISTSDSLAVQQWSEGLEAEALKRTSVFGFMGKRSDALLQIKDELQKGPGDNVLIGLRMQVTDAPRTSGDTLEGNERTMTFHTDTLYIDEMVDAVRFDNRMTRQRTTFDMRDEARAAIADQLANAIDTSFFNQIAGYDLTVDVDATFRGNNTVTAPSTGRKLFADGGTAESSMDASTAGDAFDLSLIDDAVSEAKLATPSIRPARIEGLGEYYVCFLHPDQAQDLRTNRAGITTGPVWYDVQRDMLRGGKLADNPLVTGALGVYNGVLLVENSRVPNGVTSGVADVDTRRAIFCGAQAAAVSWGRFAGEPQRFNWVEDTFEYGREWGISGGCIIGLKKLIFNSVDFGVITISTGAQDRS